VVHMSLHGGSRTTSSVVHTHSGRAHRLALLPFSSHLFYSCGEDGRCLLHDLRDPDRQKPCITFRSMYGLRCPIYVLGINPARPQEIAIGGASACVRVFDARRNGEPVAELYPSHMQDCHETVSGLKYNYTGDEIVISYIDEDIYSMNPLEHNKLPGMNYRSAGIGVESGADYVEESSACGLGSIRPDYRRRFTGHRNSDTVKQITYMGGQSEWVVSGSDCGHLFVWCARSGEVVRVLEADETGAINCLSPHPYLPLLATSGLDDDAKLFGPCPCPTSGAIDREQIADILQFNRREVQSRSSGDYQVGSIFDRLITMRQIEEIEGGIMEDSENDSEEMSDSDESDSAQWLRLGDDLRERYNDMYVLALQSAYDESTSTSGDEENGCPPSSGASSDVDEIRAAIFENVD